MTEKPTLNIDQVKFVDCMEWDRFVIACLDRPYDVLSTGEYSQDEVDGFDTYDWWSDEGEAEAKVEAWLAKPVPPAEDWSARNKYSSSAPPLQLVAEYLYAKKFLPAGNYVIRMWW